MFSLPVARFTLHQFVLLAFSVIIVLASVLAFAPSVYANDNCARHCVNLVRHGTVAGECGGGNCDDFHRPKRTYYSRWGCQNTYCGDGWAWAGCHAYVDCGGIVLDADGEEPLGEPGQAALIACALDSVSVTVDDTDDSVDASNHPTIALRWFG